MNLIPHLLVNKIRQRAGFASLKTRAVLGLAVMFLAACSRHPEPAHEAPAQKLPTVQVQVQPAESKLQTNTEEIVGTIRAKRRATLEAKVSGRIAEMPVLLGQPVQAGQLVARLDAAEINARLEQAQASLQQAERDWTRVSALFKGQAVTRSELDNAEARQRQARAAVAEAEAMMRYVEVTAPFAAVVTRKIADAGDFATPGKPLVELEDLSMLQMDADLPEALSARIQQGSQLAVRLDAVNGDLLGQVSEIAPAIDPVSRTFRVKLDLPQTPGVRSGQFARLLVPVGETSRLHVPSSAVVQRGQLEIAFVVADQRATLHLIKTGKRIGDQLEILSGLEAGDAVVVDGATLLKDGQPVEVK